MSKSTTKSALAVAPLLAGAVQSLGQTVAPATEEQVDQLIGVLGSDDSQKKKVDACRELATIGNRDAVPALVALLADERLSHMARYGLEPIPDPAVDEALRAALDKVKGQPLIGVIGSLGMRRDAKAVGLLARLLKDPDAEVAQATARALGKIGTPDAAKLLEETLAGAPAALRPVVADACLSCAEAHLANGKASEAAAIYQNVGKADLPKHFRVAAAHGAILARQSAGTP